jgi:hypothetical protein
MAETNKSYRIRTTPNAGVNTNLTVKLEQDYDFIDVLSLKLDQTNFYKTHSSSYGVVVGRVIANGGIGVPNAKLSVFIEATEDTKEDVLKNILYPYTSTTDKNHDNIRYNLLLNQLIDECYRAVGTFPSKRVVLDNDNVLEIFDQYYKFTTTTNNAGDYMIYGLPINDNKIHCDIDLSDCGLLSQKPRDMFYKGYNVEQFESSEQFKFDTNLDNLTQIISNDTSLFVYPLWGDETEDEIAITRYDIDIQYKFETTCIFMGSVITDGENATIFSSCNAHQATGNMENLTSKLGKIEMIRKTPNGSVENFKIKGDILIDSNGVWCYQIPMNLDYVTTDEFGNIIPSDNPNIGIATTASVRFRIVLEGSNNNSSNKRVGEILIPHNPQTKADYTFGNETEKSQFALLMKNNVYSIKSYIPRLQTAPSARSRNFVGIKGVSNFGNQNPFPYNHLYAQGGAVFGIICNVAYVVIWIIRTVNNLMSKLSCLRCPVNLIIWDVDFCDLAIAPLMFEFFKLFGGCVGLGKGWCTQEDYAPYPTCWCERLKQLAREKSAELYGPDTQVVDDWEVIWNCVITSLADDLKVWNFDFYNDWINGTVYLPTFNYNRYTKSKRKFLGIFGSKKTWNVIEFCGIKDNNGDVQLAIRNSLRRGWFKWGNLKLKLINTCSMAFEKGMEWKYNEDGMCINDERRSKCILTSGLFYIANNPPVILYTDNDEVEHFYYRPIIDTLGYVLFATDIILLGSMDKCNVEGIPPLYNYLISTTYQLPNPMRISEYTATSESVEIPDVGTVTNIYSTFVSSGITWGPKGGAYSAKGLSDPNSMPLDGIKRSFYYQKSYTGLFLGLACQGIASTGKSCVNAERICEIGVDLDNTRSDYVCSDNRGDDDAYYHIFDGVIFKDDIITGTEVRQIHSTLNNNHLREFNDDGSKNYTLLNGIKKYKFTYLYPQTFDSKLKAVDSAGTARSRNFIAEQISDTDYKLFRYGEEDPPSFKSFYLQTESKKAYRFPKYKNSFYFYFGRVNGSSALDVFRNKYTAKCIQNPVDGISIVVSVRQHTSVCYCTTSNTKLPEFSVIINDADTSITLSISDSDGKIIDLSPRLQTVKYKTITTTKTELVFGVDRAQVGIDFYSPEFEKGGRYTITVKSNSESVSESFTIRVENYISFDADITKAIVGNLSDLTCDGACKNDCVCCGLDTALIKPSETSLSDLKAIVNLSNFINVSNKGCKLSNYEMTINRKVLFGSGLIIHIKPDSSGHIKNNSSYYTISEPGSGYRASTSDFFESNFDSDVYIRITSVTEFGSVTGISFCSRTYNSSTNNYAYSCNSSDEYGTDLIEKDVKYGALKFDIETKIFNTSNNSSYASITNQYVNDETDFEAFNLYLCKGTYNIKLQNKKTGCENDFYILDVEVVENPPLNLIFYGENSDRRIVASNFRKRGAYSPQDDEWWNEFYVFLTTPNKPNWNTFSSWYVDLTADNEREPDDSLPYVTKNNFLEFYSEMQTIFLIECPSSRVQLDGIGYKYPYKIYLYGARLEKSQNSRVGVANLNADQYTGDTSVWNYYGYGNDTINQVTYESTADWMPEDGIKLDLPYASNNISWGLPPTDPNAFLALDDMKGITPDGMAKTTSVVPIPTRIINNYKVGGYYAAVFGENGMGNAYPGALVSLRDSIIKVPTRNSELNGKPPTVYEIFSRLRVGDYGTNCKKYFFHYHLFNKEIRIMKEWMRISAPKLNYIAPGDCTPIDLKGYFGVFYLNGSQAQPGKIIYGNTDANIVRADLGVGGSMADVRLLNLPRLGSCFTTLPIVRFAHSTANSRLSGIMDFNLNLYQKGATSWFLKCYLSVELDFSLAVENKNVSVVPYARCTSAGVLREVRNYYCYSLEITKDVSDEDLVDAGSALLGIGDYLIFDMKYNSNQTPVQMLYLDSTTDDWQTRLNYPFYSQPVEPYGDITPTKNDPGCASNGSLPATWNTYAGGTHGILTEIIPNYRRSLFAKIGGKCGNIKSTGSGNSLVMPSGEMTYSIVHDNLSETRAFSQPLDLANYIVINDIKYKKKSDGSYSIDINAEVKGNNAFGCAGYTWKIEEGTYDTVFQTGNNADKTPGNGYEMYNTAFEDGGYIKSVQITLPGEGILFRPVATNVIGDGHGATVDPILLPLIGDDGSIEGYSFIGYTVTNPGTGYTRAKVVNQWFTTQIHLMGEDFEPPEQYVEIGHRVNGTATWIRHDKEKDYTYANVVGTILTATNLELNVRDAEKIVRISATDATGVEFYTYTSLFKWIDLDERLTYCIYSCNPPLANKIGGFGVVIDLEMGVLYNINDILSGTPKAYVNNTNPSTTGQDIYNGNNIIRVGGGSGITEDYVGPLYVFNKTTNALLYTIPKAISSSCYIKYNVKI